MSTALPTRKLSVDDIDDIRAYERVRDTFRAEMIALRDRRRVSAGTIVSVAFENRETIRFQIQEIARVEGITTDEGIQRELSAYNPLIPEPGQLCATLFIELTSDEAVREWLPKLVGIEKSVVLRLPNGDEVHSCADSPHGTQVPRDDVTAAVHYISFELTPAQCDAFQDGVVLAIEHPRYTEQTELRMATIRELASDLRGS